MTIIIDLSGGLVNGVDQSKIADNQLYKAVDLDFTDVGNARCRSLNTLNSYFKDVSFSAAVYNIFQTDVEGINKRLIAYSSGNTLYVWNSLTGVVHTAASNIKTNQHISYATLRPELSTYTYIYATDGNTMLAHNGTTLKTWGIDKPSGSPTTRVGATSGSLSTGSYQYVYTFYDNATGTESEPSPASAKLSVTSGQSVQLNDILISGDSRVTSRRLYRTLAAGGYYYLVGTIPDNTITDFIDGIGDSQLTIQAITDADIPPVGDVVFSYKNMLLLGGISAYPDRLYYCIPQHPDNWPSTYWQSTTSAGLGIINIHMFADVVYFMHKGGVSRLHGETIDAFTIRSTEAHVGSAARWSSVSGLGGIYFLSYDGIYRFDGRSAVRVSDRIQKIFDKVATTDVEIIDRSSMSAVCRGAFMGSSYYLLAPMQAIDGSVTNRLIVYDVIRNTWVIHAVACTDIYADESKGELYGALTYSSAFTVHNLLTAASSSVDSASPILVTKAYPVTSDAQYQTTPTGMKRTYSPEIGWLSKFKIDALGTWTLEFFVDDRSVYSVTLTDLNSATKNLWHRLPDGIKGQVVHVKATASSTPQPETHIFRGMLIV